MGLFWRNPNIQVQFIEAGSKRVFAESEIPLADLPDAYTQDSTVHVHGVPWVVLAAQPSKKSEFVKTGRLRVVLSKLCGAGLARTRFFVPTLARVNGELIEEDAFINELFVINRDDWRQREFVSIDQARAIEDELDDIRAIREKKHRGSGYDAVHLRRRIPDPLYPAIVRRETLPAIFGQLCVFEGVAYHGCKGRVARSFAWTAKMGATFWGQEKPQGGLESLCLSIDSAVVEDKIEALAGTLAQFTNEANLYFVDWCNAAKLRGDAAAFKACIRAIC